jgi:Cu/Ag efflux pump CusA
MAESERLIPGSVIISTAAGACALLLTFSPLMCQMTVAHGTLAGRGEYWSRKREGMYSHVLRKVLMSKKKILLITQN